MASQLKIQEYLQRHKIGALFEELMGKIVVDQPADPIRHLIGILQTKLDPKSSIAMVSKSINGPVPVQTRSHSPERSKMSASFAGEKLASEKDRSYNKPWLSNTKPMKRSDSMDRTVGSKSAQKSGEKSGKLDASGFDDIFDDSTSKKLGASAPLNVLEEKKTLFTPFQHSVNQIVIVNRFIDVAQRITDEELLMEEVPVSMRQVTETLFPDVKNITSGKTSSSISSSTSAAVSRFCKGPKSTAQNHKKKLEEVVLEQQLLKKKQQQDHSDDSGYDEHLARDSAIELLEDVELLRMEGARNVKASGHTVRHVPAVDVKVSICALCARFMDGNIHQTQTSPVAAVGVTHGLLPVSAKDKESSSRPASARSTKNAALASFTEQRSPIEEFLAPNTSSSPQSPGLLQSDDEEIESVSQVDGPRYPVWQDDDEEITPRKGSHMLTETVKSTKTDHSRHSVNISSDNLLKKTATNGTPRSRAGSATAHKPSSTVGRKNSAQVSDDENFISSLTKNSNQWVVPDYDTDGSTVYVTGGAKSTTKHYKPRAY